MLLNCVTVSLKPFVCIDYIREPSQLYAATHSVTTFASTLLLQLCTLSHRDLSLYTAKASAAIESNVEEALERLSESVDELHEEYPDANIFSRLLHAAFAAATSCVVCSNPKLPQWQPFLRLPTSSNASNAFVAHAPTALFLLHSFTNANATGNTNVTGNPRYFSADYTQLALGAVLNMHLGRKSATAASTRTSTSFSTSTSTSTTAPALPLRPETRALGAAATSAPTSSRNSPSTQHPNSDATAASSFAGGTLPEREGDETLEDREEEEDADAPSRPQSAVASRPKSFTLNEDGTFSGQDLLKLLDAKQHARTVRRLISAGLLRNHSADKTLVETFHKLDKYTQYTVWVRVSQIESRYLLMGLYCCTSTFLFAVSRCSHVRRQSRRQLSRAFIPISRLTTRTARAPTRRLSRI